jgi:SAM-dependent methyltransferase
MDHETQRLLGEINRRFYTLRAADFSATRSYPWPGWERLIPELPERAIDRGLRVLDVGCGNGRFGRFLLDREVALETYVGIDSSPVLLEYARESLAGLLPEECQLILADFLTSEPDAALPSGHFELVGAFGLLHHVPGHAVRRALLRAMARRVTPGGLLVCTFWRFGSIERFEPRVIGWEDYNRDSSDPVDTSQLEEGDHLLAFGGSEGPPRYCHHHDDAEIASLLDASELDVRLRFDADGRGGNLNHYTVMQRSA